MAKKKNAKKRPLSEEEREKDIEVGFGENPLMNWRDDDARGEWWIVVLRFKAIFVLITAQCQTETSIWVLNPSVSRVVG